MPESMGFEIEVPLAFAAVTADPAIGLLLPCNVSVEAIDAALRSLRKGR